MQNDGGYGGVPFFLRCPLSSTHYPPSPSFHIVVHSLHSFAKERNSTLLLSWVSALFHKNTGCGGKEHTTYQGLRNSPDGLRQFANFLLELLAVAAAIGKRRAQPGMKFARPCLLRKLQDVGSIDSSARDNHDPVPRGGDQFGKNSGPLGSALHATRCENPVRIGFDHLLERLLQIGS